MIDTHAHLDFNQFDKNRQRIIEHCFNNGIKKIINIGCNLKTSQSSIELAQKYKNIYAGVGIHPHDIYELVDIKKQKYIIKKSVLNKIKKLAQQDKVVAIGEIGLDYYFSQTQKQKKEQCKKMQTKGFKAQLKLAQQLNLPVVFHIREAHSQVLSILQKQAKIKGVVHCFSTSWNNAQKYLNLGLFISFTGLITFTHSYDKAIKNIPLEKILLETDCPFLAPVPYRGKICQPWMVKFVAQKIAKLKHISLVKMVEQTNKNAIKLFGL